MDDKEFRSRLENKAANCERHMDGRATDMLITARLEERGLDTTLHEAVTNLADLISMLAWFRSKDSGIYSRTGLIRLMAAARLNLRAIELELENPGMLGDTSEMVKYAMDIKLEEPAWQPDNKDLKDLASRMKYSALNAVAPENYRGLYKNVPDKDIIRDRAKLAGEVNSDPGDSIGNAQLKAQIAWCDAVLKARYDARDALCRIALRDAPENPDAKPGSVSPDLDDIQICDTKTLKEAEAALTAAFDADPDEGLISSRYIFEAIRRETAGDRAKLREMKAVLNAQSEKRVNGDERAALTWLRQMKKIQGGDEAQHRNIDVAIRALEKSIADQDIDPGAGKDEK